MTASSPPLPTYRPRTGASGLASASAALDARIVADMLREEGRLQAKALARHHPGGVWYHGQRAETLRRVLAMLGA